MDDRELDQRLKNIEWMLFEIGRELNIVNDKGEYIPFEERELVPTGDEDKEQGEVEIIDYKKESNELKEKMDKISNPNVKPVRFAQKKDD